MFALLVVKQGLLEGAGNQFLPKGAILIEMMERR
jgi:hypothetical protein